jgi:Mrp family chromosome partitioning ATPase
MAELQDPDDRPAPSASPRRWRLRRKGDPRSGGGLRIVDANGGTLHDAPPEVMSAIRYMLARLQLNGAAGIPGRLGLSSAVAGEGVSFVARSLAAAIAHDLGRSVCVVSLNWSPSNPDDVLIGRPGVADVLYGHATIDEVLVRSDDPRLVLAPSGEVELSRRPVVAKHPALDHVLDDLAMRFDHLLVELPAVRASSDALVLVRHCDAFALVVRHGVTPDHVVRSTFEELRGAVSLGVVLNCASSRVPPRVARLVAP